MSAHDDAVKAVEKNLRETLDYVEKALKGDELPLQSRLAFVAGLLQGASWGAVDDLKKLGVLR